MSWIHPPSPSPEVPCSNKRVKSNAVANTFISKLWVCCTVSYSTPLAVLVAFTLHACASLSPAAQKERWFIYWAQCSAALSRIVRSDEAYLVRRQEAVVRPAKKKGNCQARRKACPAVKPIHFVEPFPPPAVKLVFGALEIGERGILPDAMLWSGKANLQVAELQR